MSDHRQPFLDAIIADPWDDGPRLLFADWLEDQGESDRAEFIRVQCALAAMRDDGLPVAHDLDGRCACSLCALRRREQELLLFPCGPAKDGGLPVNCWEWVSAAAALVPDGAVYSEYLTFRRGFIECVRCPAAAWLARGAAVLARQPVLVVDLGLRAVERAREESVEDYRKRLEMAARLVVAAEKWPSLPWRPSS